MDCSFLRDRVTGMVWWVDRMIWWDLSREWLARSEVKVIYGLGVDKIIVWR